MLRPSLGLGLIAGMKNKVCPAVESIFDTIKDGSYPTEGNCKTACSMAEVVFNANLNLVLLKESHHPGATTPPLKYKGYRPQGSVFPPNPGPPPVFVPIKIIIQ